MKSLCLAYLLTYCLVHVNICSKYSPIIPITKVNANKCNCKTKEVWPEACKNFIASGPFSPALFFLCKMWMLPLPELVTYESLASCHFQSSQVSMRSISKLFDVAAADAAVIFCNNVTVTVFMCKDRLYFCFFFCQNNKEASQWINRKVVVLQSQWIKLLCSLCCDSSATQFHIFAIEYTEKLLKRTGFFIQKNLYYRLEARSEYRAFTQFICKVKSRTNSN